MEFDINLKLKTKEIDKESSAKVHAKLGSEFSIEREDLRVVFIAQEYKEKGKILIKAKVYSKINNKIKLLGQPQIISLIGKEATLSVENENGESFEIKLKSSDL